MANLLAVIITVASGGSLGLAASKWGVTRYAHRIVNF